MQRGDPAEEAARLRPPPGFDMDVGGPTLASPLIRAGLVDEYRLVVDPVIQGAGTLFFPTLEDPVETRTAGGADLASGATDLRDSVNGRQ